MAKRTRFAEYKDGDSLVRDWEAHDGISDAFAHVAGDLEIKALDRSWDQQPWSD